MYINDEYWSLCQILPSIILRTWSKSWCSSPFRLCDSQMGFGEKLLLLLLHKGEWVEAIIIDDFIK